MLKKSRGFSLIEIMIVVAIIGIIAAIAVPSYQDSVRKGRRSDATIALSEARGNAGTPIFRNTSYVTNAELSKLVSNSDGVSSKEGFYTLAVDNSACNGPPYNCFSITATAVGPQAADSKCATFTINHIGQKTSTPAGNDCW